MILNINNGLLELPGRNLAVGQDVAFTAGAVLELRKEEESHHPADASGIPPSGETCPALAWGVLPYNIYIKYV